MKERWKKGRGKKEEDAAILDQDFHGISEAERRKSMKNQPAVYELTNRLKVPTILGLNLFLEGYKEYLATS